MSVRKESVSMPMGSAGIVGMSSDMKLEGIEIDPKVLVLGTFVLVVLVKAASILVH